ncbi:Pentatricopeptide repeat-containing protein mitochondrial [Heracleum sosnowskyi]|uniref:Pentatricopeptide repeat-containing protein mitochondrial n=1 Tax=Heracleum sosnowskyi TaxID=360622 RepID=A0AAD8GP80_9APIA|nr:Pentatricopeptide repeat-containing protein mitochondrial [Heracleum sosnowskyi]
MRRQAALILNYTHSFVIKRLKFTHSNHHPSCSSSLIDEFELVRDSISNNTSGNSTSSNHVVLLITAFRDNDDNLLRQFRAQLNPDLVIRVLNSMPNAELCLHFFIWAGRQIGYTHSIAVFDALLDVLCCGETRRLSHQLLTDIKQHDKDALEKLLNVMITKYSNNGSWNLALEELARLKDFGYRPSRGTYNALLQVLLQSHNLDTAILLHKEMLHLGLFMDRYTLGCFAYTLCKSGKWKQALDLIDKEEFTPDTVIYSQMISGLCEASLFEEAMDVLNIMRTNSCLPNVVTYKILLCGCLNKHKLGRCKRILSMMITEGCYPSPKIFNSLVHAFCKTGEYTYAYKLLRKMVACGCPPGYVVYNILIGGICGKNELPSLDEIDLAEKAYTQMLDAGFVLNKINVSNFARCLCGVGKFDKAQKIISEMMAKGFIPDTSTYSHVISFLCNASKVDKAFLLFNDMKRDGCAPNVVTYTALIHSYLKARKVSDANELFQLMIAEGCVPNIVTFSALIDGYCKSGETDKACQIYARMMEVKEYTDVNMYFEVDNNKSMEPNVVTYGALVDGLCKTHRVEEARNLLDVMSSKGCEPNHIVYDALIDGYCKVGKLDEAQEIFFKMSEHGYSPNAYTYSSLIDRFFKDKRLDLALRVLSKMLENSCAPNVVIYTEMIDGLCKVQKTDEAYKLMLMMEEKGCHPNVVTYTAMMDGFGKAGKVSKSLDLLRQMGAKGCAPNYVTYTVLINHCCAAGLLDDAHQLLEEMKQTYWPRHVASYSKVIDGFSRDFISSLDLLAEMNECESIPLVPVYGLMIDCFRKAGRLEVALKLHEDISSSLVGSYIKTNVFPSLIESLCYSNKFEKAFGLYADMIRKGGLSDISDFTSLIKGLIRMDRWEEALQLSHSLCCMDIIWIPSKNTNKSD